MSAIDNFLDRYHRAVNSKSKELRLQMSEAEELAHELARLATKNFALAEEVINLQKRLISSENSQENQEDKIAKSGSGLVLDAGRFKSS